MLQTQSEISKGYAVCECERFVFIFRVRIIAALPADYQGELCSECGMWVCAVDKLPNPAPHIPRPSSGNTPEPR